ncbi:YadA-like family protein [Vreelandella sp. 2A-K22]
MNSIFRIVRNRTLGRLVVTSEAARACGKPAAQQGAVGAIPATVDANASLSGRFCTYSVLASALILLGMVAPQASFAAKDATLTGSGDGLTVGDGTSANDDGLTTLYWDNPYVLGLGLPIDYSGGLTVPGAVAIGTNAEASSNGSVVIGASAIAEAPMANQGASVVVGAYSYAGSNNNVVIGNRGVATGWAAMALGRESTSQGRNAISFGNVSSALGDGSLAMGLSSLASGERAIAIGSADSSRDHTNDSTQAIGTDSLAFGTRAVADQQDASAFGREAVASGTQAVAIGTSANATANQAVAIGASTQAALSATAIGGQAESTGERSVAIGVLSDAQGNDSLAVGNQAVSTAADSLALGSNASSSAASATAIGSNSQASGENAFSAGSGSLASGQNSLAIGQGAIATGDQSISIGTANEVAGVGSGAIGDPSYVSGDGTYTLGNDNGTAGSPIAADEAGIFGNNNMMSAAATGSRIVGNNNDIDVAEAFVVGNGADVTEEGGVALGSGSVSDTGAAVVGYNPITGAADGLDPVIAATSSSTGAVAVGNPEGGVYRQITGVAAGSEDSDAVNVAQLKASETHYYSVNDNGVIGGNYANDGATGVNALAAGVDASATADESVALGAGSIADGSTLGSAAYQPLDADGNPIPVAAPTAASEVSVGSAGNERRITNVAAGAEDTDAVNVSQLAAVESVASTGWDLTAQGADPTNVAPGDTVDLSNTDGNLVIGKNAVDGTQEDVTFDLADDVAVNSSVTVGSVVTDATTNDITGLSNTTLTDPSFATVGRAATEEQLDLVSTGLSTQGLDFAGDSGTDVHRDLGQDLNVVGGSDASGNTNISTVADGTDTLEIVMTDQPQFGDVTINTTGGNTINGLSNLTFDSNAFTSGQAATEDQLAQVSDVASAGWDLTAQGIDTTNVAPGDTVDLSNTDGNLVIAKNATDGAQETVTFDLSDEVTIGDTTINDSGIDMGGDTITNVGNPINDGDAVNLEYFETNKAHYYSVNDGGVIGGNYDNDGATGVNAMASGVGALASAEGSMALGFGTQANIEGSVALGDGASATRTTAPTSGIIPAGTATITYNTNDHELLGAMSVGRDADAYRQIVNVADGTQQQDAVTIRQLQGAIGSVTSTGTMYFHANSSAADSLAVGQESIAVGPETIVNGDNGIGIGNGALVESTAPGGTAIGQEAYVSLPDALAMGTQSEATGEQAVAIGAGASADEPSSVALGGNSATDPVVATTGITLEGEDYTFAGDAPVGTVSVGSQGAERTITHVAAGRIQEDSTDAVNGSQLYTTNEVLGGLSESLTEIAGDTSPTYIDDNGRGIRYVRTNEAGLPESDAFAQTPGSTAVGYEASATAEDALALGRSTQANHAGSVALGAGAATSEAVGTAEIEIAGQTYQFAGQTPLGTVSIGTAGAERTLTHVAAGRVSDSSTDAINGSQLYATNQAVAAVEGQVNNVEGDVTQLDERVTNVEGDVTNLGNSIGNLNDQAVKYDTNPDGSVDYDTITLAGDGGTTIANVADGDVSETSSDAVNGSQLWEVQNQVTNIEEKGSKYYSANAEGAAAEANGEESLAMGPESTANGDSSVSIGDGATANSDGGVALGAGSEASRDGMNGQEEAFSGESVASNQGAVSVGRGGGERQITHVAGGTEATDAVNVRQLEAVQAGAVNYDYNEDGSVDYGSVTLGEDGTPTQIHNVAAGEADTDAVNVGQMRDLSQRFEQQLGGVHNRIDDVEDRANAGTASALAAASVPQAYLPGKSMVAVGAGTYGGESAVSVGTSRLSDNGRWAIKLNATGDSQGNFGAGIGAGFHW